MSSRSPMLTLPSESGECRVIEFAGDGDIRGTDKQRRNNLVPALLAFHISRMRGVARFDRRRQQYGRRADCLRVTRSRLRS